MRLATAAPARAVVSNQRNTIPRTCVCSVTQQSNPRPWIARGQASSPAARVATPAFTSSATAVPWLLTARPAIAVVDGGAAASTAAAGGGLGGLLDTTLLAVLGVILAGGLLVLCVSMFNQMDPDSFDNNDERAIGKGTNYDDGSGFNF